MAGLILSLGAALAAGLLSFLSPCVLPLIPSFLSFLGAAEGIASGEAPSFRRRMGRVTAFVSGFSLVFVAAGILLSQAFALFSPVRSWLALGSGILVIILGLNAIFDFIKALGMEKRFHAARADSLPTAFLFGMAFAAGWSPCVGPMLASILALAGSSGDIPRALILLLAYSAGLALPFLAFGAALSRLKGFLAFLKRHALAIRIASGALLILIGLAIASGGIARLPALFGRAAWSMEAFSATAASRIIFTSIWAAGTLFSGLLAFRSMRRSRHKDEGLRPSAIVALVLGLAFLALCALEALGVLNGGWILSKLLVLGMSQG